MPHSGFYKDLILTDGFAVSNDYNEHDTRGIS